MLYLEQEAALHQVVEGVDTLANSLIELYSLDEDDALEIVRELPDLVNKIQDNKLRELFERATRRARPRVVKFNQPNPDEFYPGHPKFRPNVTTKSTFNEHMAQALGPYVEAIVKKVARDRGLQPPETRVIQATLEQTDWARAAYEAKRMPPKPPPSQLRRFFRKYLGPIERRVSGATGTMFGAAMSAMTLWLMFQAFKNSAEAAGGSVKSFIPFSHASQHRMQNKLQRKMRVPRRFRTYKTY